MSKLQDCLDEKLRLQAAMGDLTRRIADCDAQLALEVLQAQTVSLINDLNRSGLKLRMPQTARAKKESTN